MARPAHIARRRIGDGQQHRSPHALAQAVFTFKQGRIADRGHDARQFRASGLNLVIAVSVALQPFLRRRAEG